MKYLAQQIVLNYNNKIFYLNNMNERVNADIRIQVPDGIQGQLMQGRGDFYLAEDDNFIQELNENERLELEQIRRNIHEERKVAENILFRSNEQ